MNLFIQRIEKYWKVISISHPFPNSIKSSQKFLQVSIAFMDFIITITDYWRILGLFEEKFAIFLENYDTKTKPSRETRTYRPEHVGLSKYQCFCELWKRFSYYELSRMARNKGDKKGRLMSLYEPAVYCLDHKNWFWGTCWCLYYIKAYESFSSLIQRSTNLLRHYAA